MASTLSDRPARAAPRQALAQGGMVGLAAQRDQRLDAAAPQACTLAALK